VFVTNHVLSGVVIGRALERRPVTAFLVGVGSHLVLDAIPHWGCDLRTEGGPDRFLRVAKRDGVLGLATMATATLAVDRRSRTSTVAAMAGAALLDLDKPCLYFLGINPFPRTVMRVHKWAQNESPDGMPNEFAFGVVSVVAGSLMTWASLRRNDAVRGTTGNLLVSGLRRDRCWRGRRDRTSRPEAGGILG
jgi:hypothetical protein